MGASMMGGNSRRYGGRRRYTPMAEINVTPMVDVMLVLLIVFMVTAPLMTVGVPVDLPKTKAAQLTDSEEPLVLTVNKDGKIYIQETAIELENLVPRLQAITENNADIRIFVRGDKEIAYGKVMEVMGQVSAAGFKKVALLAKLPGQK
ncbi:protein TolR [Aestuariispira ectoiniformans]|uniref:protein TolR n=1 Tax=Aestuariispira ectoiniformans TaxID=2775080 RepID=UPI0021E40284|nr:protein TolR [Aestuariispira ectoiniformans]